MLYLDPGEHVLLEVRRHWFVFVSQAVLHTVAALIPFVLYKAMVPLIGFSIPVNPHEKGLVIFLYALWLLSIWISFFVQWTKYYLDVWYVTEKRIIDVEQKRLFSRTISNLRFDKIQDITITVSGILATFLDIGDIHVQTAAENSGDFTMRLAGNPEKIRSFIFAQHNMASEKSTSSSI